jgi:hypothetical protein
MIKVAVPEFRCALRRVAVDYRCHSGPASTRLFLRPKIRVGYSGEAKRDGRRSVGYFVFLFGDLVHSPGFFPLTRPASLGCPLVRDLPSTSRPADSKTLRDRANPVGPEDQ